MHALITIEPVHENRVVVELSVNGRSFRHESKLDIDRYANVRMRWNEDRTAQWVRVRSGDDFDGEPSGPVNHVIFGTEEKPTDVGKQLRDAITNSRARVFTILLHVRCDPELVNRGHGDLVRCLHLLPWELMGGGRGGEALVREGLELIRIVTPSESSGWELEHVTRIPAPFAHLTAASPLTRGHDEQDEPFNAVPLSHQLEAGMRAGFRGRVTTSAEVDRPSWAAFRGKKAFIKVFLGHGKAAAKDHLKFFSPKGGVWTEEHVEAGQLREQWSENGRARGPKHETLLALVACDSNRVVASALVPQRGGAHQNAIPPPLILACQSEIPVQHGAELVRVAVNALATHGTSVGMMHEIRQELRKRPETAHLQHALVLYQHPAGGSKALWSQRSAVVDGLSARVEAPPEQYLGFSTRDLQDRLAELATQIGSRAAASPPFRKCERVHVAPFWMSTACVTRWQIYRALGEKSGFTERDVFDPILQRLPAIVHLELAEAYANHVLGRLPTPDEFEAAASGPRRSRTEPPVIGDLKFAGWKDLPGNFERVEDEGEPTRVRSMLPADDSGGPPNGYGMLHMLGNAKEWALEEGQVYCMGGSFKTNLIQCLPQARILAEPGASCAFRVVWS